MSRKIGILEICEPNHYSAVNGLMKSYASDSQNHVYVFTIPKITKALQENGLRPNIEIVEWDEKGSMADFLQKVAQYPLDRLHVCTVYIDYKAFVGFNPQAKEIYNHVHDIDLWFNDSMSRAWKVMWFDLSNKTANRAYYRIVGRFFLEALFNSRYRSTYLKNLQKRPHHFIVHSNGQKNLLAKFVAENKITVFPFSIYEGLADQSQQNTQLRICIPGIITSERRDYATLFEILVKRIGKLKGRILLDLLGFIPEREKTEMEALIADTQQKGIDIIYYPGFVFGKQFDDMLSRADVLLNNQKVEKNPSEKYGVTKESGMIFNMLRGAKPGMIPSQYQVNDEYKPSTLFFDDYEQLGDMIVELVENTVKIQSLKTNAIQLSEQYLPERLYERLSKSWK
jgi:hypothetical protein